ncbi:MAG: hypothetical protein HDR72_06990 [Ruminococcaceae bacterium]|nr:hypothetical protein [Oscillospiraceae bacterium]
MKIGEASRIYSAQMSKLREKRNELLEQKKSLEKGEIQMTEEEAASLGKAIDTINFRYDRATEFMEGFNMQKMFLHSSVANRQAGESMAKRTEEQAKCMEIARRIARGDKVPLKDEQKLLEYNSDIYQMSKNMAAMAKNEKRKKYESLWKKEEENKNEPSASDVVDNMECSMEMPAGLMDDESFE